MGAFGEKTQTYFRKKSHGKVNDNLKFQNFDFSRKNEILEFQFFIDFSIEQVSENNFVFFYQKLPSLKINISALRSRFPFKFDLK